MNPSIRQASFCVLLVLALGCGCTSKKTRDQAAIRAELAQAMRERSYERAAQLAHTVVGFAPQKNGSWEHLVRAQLRLGDLDGARQSLEEWRGVIRQRPAKWDELTGDLAIRQRDPALALEAWAKALAAQPDSARVLRKIARTQRAERRWTHEDAALTRLLQLEDNATDRINRALCRRRLHRWSEALEDAQRARALDPDDPVVRRGAKLFDQLGTFLDAIRKLDARLAVTPDDDQLMTDRALLFLRSEDAELALDDGAAAAQMAPWAMRPRLFRAIALIQLGRGGECDALGIDRNLRLEALSVESLETMSRLDAEISVERTNADLYVARAWQLNDIGQPTLALEDAQSAEQADAQSAGAAAEAGYALAMLGRADEAFQQIKRATERDANYSTAWQYRGELEMSRGDHSAAIESLSRALAISQTRVALQKREECYRQLGLLVKAEEDKRALADLNARGLN